MALFLLIVLFLNFDESISFLVNTTNTGLTSYEFQPLSQYIIDEKQLRHRLESDFASLQQELKNTKTTLEQQLNNTKSELGAVKTILSQHSKNYESLRLQQDKDASNRNQIQHELTGLIEDFQNLSIAFSGTHTTGQVFNGTNKTGRVF